MSKLFLEMIMPTLPSGRRVEFSLDRFHALLSSLPPERARKLVTALCEPDDLLFVLDAVHFSQQDGTPYFADYVAADWAGYAADWNTPDRQVLQAWTHSHEARSARAEAIAYLQALYLGLDNDDTPVAYPYLVHGRPDQAGMVHSLSRLRQ